MTEDAETPTLTKLISGPGIATLAILGIVVGGASRLLGTDTIFREMVTEVVASFGNAILILAMFELFFKAGVERLVRRATGSNAYAETVQHMRETLQSIGQGNQGTPASSCEEKLNRIEESLLSLVDKDVPDLKNDIGELRRLILDAAHGQEQ